MRDTPRKDFAGRVQWIRAGIIRHRWKLLGGVCAFVAQSLLSPYIDLLHGGIKQDPSLGVYILVAFSLVAVVGWALIGTRDREPIGWGMTLFWLAYCLVFLLADTTDLLAWSRPQGFEAVDAPKVWSGLLPSGWGDWRYRFVGAPPVSDPGRIVLVLRTDSSSGKRKLRSEDASLMLAALREGATVVGIDASYAGGSGVDGLFCSDVRKLNELKLPLVTAYEMRLDPRVEEFVPFPDATEPPQCGLSSDQGQAMSLVDSDGRIRGIPLYWTDWSNEMKYPAFSLEVAKYAGAKTPPRKDRYLRLLRPPDGAIKVLDSPARIIGMGADSDFLGKKILIVGSTSPADRFATPFGIFAGAQMHAFAVFDLLHGYYIRQCPWLLSAIIIYGSCLRILQLWWRYATVRRLGAEAFAMSIIVLGLAAALMHWLLLWVNVIFAITAVWLLIPILHLRSRWSLYLRNSVKARPALPRSV